MKYIKKNKKAFFDYEILQEFICGIILNANEIKNIKSNNFNFTSNYITILDNNYVALKNFNGTSEHRKLLLKKNEIIKLKSYIEKKGYSIIPLELFIDRSLIKIKIGVGKGKKLYDKKEVIKARDVERYENMK